MGLIAPSTGADTTTTPRAATFEVKRDGLEPPLHQRLGDREDVHLEPGFERLDHQVLAIEEHPLARGITGRHLAEPLHQRVLTTRDAFHSE